MYFMASRLYYSLVLSFSWQLPAQFQINIINSINLNNMQQTLKANNVINETNIDEVMQNAFDAFNQYKRLSSKQRAKFLETIADEIEKSREQLVAIAHEETNLPLPRLNGE